MGHNEVLGRSNILLLFLAFGFGFFLPSVISLFVLMKLNLSYDDVKI